MVQSCDFSDTKRKKTDVKVLIVQDEVLKLTDQELMKPIKPYLPNSRKHVDDLEKYLKLKDRNVYLKKKIQSIVDHRF